MSSHSFLKFALASSTALAALTATAAFAAPTQFLTPNVIAIAGATTTTMGGVTFTNQGLQGVARIPAGTKDFNNDTLGAFSSLDVLPGSWRKNADGSYSGTLYGLPDRGPNGIGAVNFSDYPGRVNIYNMSFSPYTGATALSASANVLSLTPNGGFFLKDFNGNVTTGLDPGGAPGATSFVTQNGMNLPGSTVGAAAGKISLDAEGLRFLQNGNFYVSDEYGANVYYFNSSGQMLGVIQPPAALIPRNSASGTTAASLSYTSNNPTDPVVGRRGNQGMEGMAIMPDQKHLATLLQSATEQDSTTANQATRTNTRLMIYDISQTSTPAAPVGDYVLQLPIYRTTGNGAAANATAAQSELLALNDTQFLVLARDANGLGLANNPFVFKSVLLVDITGATNIAGTPYETGYTPISPGGNLLASITPVQQTELVNILNTTQLAKFGINTNNGAGAANSTTLTEKWEGMALVPALEEGAPQDYFLLVGNDDDFLAANCKVGGEDCAQSVNSDSLVLAYRLTLPTYVDPTFLRFMTVGGPISLGMTQMAGHDLAISGDLDRHLQDLAQGGLLNEAQLAGIPLSVWAKGSFVTRGESSLTTAANIHGGTAGLDAELDPGLVAGLAVGYYSGSAKSSGGYKVDPSAVQISVYGAWSQGPMHANLSGTYSSQDFDNILRPAAFGLTAHGKTSGDGLVLNGEFGFGMPVAGITAGPVVGFRYLDLDISGYDETGAAGGNIRMPGHHDSGFSGFIGGEASVAIDAVTASARLVYAAPDLYHAGPASFVLINAGNVMGTQSVLLPELGQAHVEPSISIAGGSWLRWTVSYGARLGVTDGTEHHVTAGLRIGL